VVGGGARRGGGGGGFLTLGRVDGPAFQADKADTLLTWRVAYGAGGAELLAKALLMGVVPDVGPSASDSSLGLKVIFSIGFIMSPTLFLLPRRANNEAPTMTASHVAALFINYESGAAPFRCQK